MALESPEAKQTQGMAVFAVSGQSQILALPSDEPFEDRLVVNEEPYLVPLLEAELRHREYLVVLTDTHRGRLYAAVPGESRLLDQLDEAVPKKNRSSGERWGKQQATIARHREDHILHYQKELARRVEAAWNAHPYQGIILLGEHEVLENFRDLLPRRLADRVVHEAPHSWSGEQPEIHEHVREVVASAIASRQQALVEELGRRLREGYAVTTGPQETIESLRNGQVLDLILVGPDPGEAASRCSGCRSIFATPETTCPYCHSPCVKADLRQEILSLALQHAVSAHVVRDLGDEGPVVPGGVAALLARDEPQWTTGTAETRAPNPEPAPSTGES
jgi:peptide subunit release factor 1 (eRF1)